MREVINQVIVKFDHMPPLMRFLVALGLAAPLFVINVIFTKGVTLASIGLSVLFVPSFVGAYLMILKSKYSRFLYITGMLLVVFSPCFLPTVSDRYLSEIELFLNLFFAVIIGTYLFKSSSVSNYFLNK
jgi:hypothetical protein